MNESEKRIVEEVKRSFAKVYISGNNDQEVKKLVSMLNLKDYDHCLDLGTGNGYVAFGIAEDNVTIHVDGMDVVESMIIRNRKEVVERKLNNISFLCYEGVDFPLDSKCYDGIVARYTLHHFPNIGRTLQEIDRVLKDKSRLVICDCIPTPTDQSGFLDKWMKIIGDGHVSFWRTEDYERMLKQYGFRLVDQYHTTIRCQRTKSVEYMELLRKYPVEADSYHYIIEDKRIWLEEPVVHLAFER